MIYYVTFNFSNPEYIIKFAHIIYGLILITPNLFSIKDLEIMNRMTTIIEENKARYESIYGKIRHFDQRYFWEMLPCHFKLHEKENINKYKNLPISNCSFIGVDFEHIHDSNRDSLFEILQDLFKK